MNLNINYILFKYRKYQLEYLRKYKVLWIRNKIPVKVFRELRIDLILAKLKFINIVVGNDVFI